MLIIFFAYFFMFLCSSACGCPPALRDDTPHEGCLGEQSFKPSIFISSQKFSMYIEQGKGSIFLLGSLSVFSHLI